MKISHFLYRLTGLACASLPLISAAALNLPRPRDVSSECFTTTLVEAVPEIVVKETVRINPGNVDTSTTTVFSTITTYVLTTMTGQFCEIITAAHPSTTTAPAPKPTLTSTTSHSTVTSSPIYTDPLTAVTPISDSLTAVTPVEDPLTAVTPVEDSLTAVTPVEEHSTAVTPV